MNNTRKHIREHFSHEHPLIFNDEVDLDSDDIEPKSCSVCGITFFNNSYYSCSRTDQGCHFLLHQQCADRLPRVLPASLLVDPARDEDASQTFNFTLIDANGSEVANKKCLKCDQIISKSYAYTNFWGHLHPLCGVALEITIKHRSHEHLLAPMRKTICGVCNVCGEEERGVFFSCQTCEYSISQGCALLPSVAMHSSHSHPLVLFYKNFDIEMPLRLSLQHCDICREIVGFKSFYSCGTCRHSVHLRCIKTSIKNITPQESRKYIGYLPAATIDTVFSSIASNLKQDEEVYPTSTSFITMEPEEFHEHRLVFNGIADDEVVDDLEEGRLWGSKGLCDACINPINSSTPYYSCSVTQCHFLVHEYCANLPSRIKGKLYDSSSRLILFNILMKEFFSIFCCEICHYYCNGFGYSISPRRSHWCVDVECAFVPRVIKHESHKSHYLHLIRKDGYQSGGTNCCPMKYHGQMVFHYHCTCCASFKIHVRCALMPRKVSHKFDKHLLRLITDGGELAGLSIRFDRGYLENCGFCEVCENVIDPEYWFYFCAECDHYFHVNCIPSVGKLSKIKFGGTLDDLDCHDHPVTSVRMLTVGTQRCTYCKKTIHGFKDDLAFHCEFCNVWIHSRCARKSSRYYP